MRLRKIKEEPKYTEDDPILLLVALGKEIWEGIDPDEYVQNLRRGWE